jgi:hypothetical protein
MDKFPGFVKLMALYELYPVVPIVLSSCEIFPESTVKNLGPSYDACQVKPYEVNESKCASLVF